MAKFQEVMKHAKRMCGEHKTCEDCALKKSMCPIVKMPSKWNANTLEEVERIIMDWAEKNPGPRYPSWNEWQGANFRTAGRAICAAHFVDGGDAGCYTPGNDCDECRERPIPADIAEKLGIKPIGGDAK